MYEVSVTRLDLDSWYYDVSVVCVLRQQITCQFGWINDEGC